MFPAALDLFDPEWAGSQQHVEQTLGAAGQPGYRHLPYRPTAVAAWLEAHRSTFIECDRHNGLARLTAQTCAGRYRRAVAGWVESLNIHNNDRQALRLSFAICATCPVGLYHAIGHDPVGPAA